MDLMASRSVSHSDVGVELIAKCTPAHRCNYINQSALRFTTKAHSHSYIVLLIRNFFSPIGAMSTKLRPHVQLTRPDQDFNSLGVCDEFRIAEFRDRDPAFSRCRLKSRSFSRSV
jgi:hypothetical protein